MNILELIAMVPSQEEVQIWMESFGVWGWFFYLGFGSLSVAFTPLNFSAVALSGGFVYGTFLAALTNWACKVVGTCVGFLAFRKFGRGLLKFVVPKKKIRKFDHLIEHEKTILLYAVTCFIPFMPSDNLAYVLGMSSLKFRHFVPITIIGNSGTAFALAFIGSGQIFTNPLYMVTLAVMFIGGMIFIHRHRKQYHLHV